MGAKTAKKLPPPDALAIIDLASRVGDLTKAKRLYQGWLAATDSPLAYVVRFNLGVILADLGELGEAIACYRESLAVNPGFMQAEYNLGSALERLGKPEEAIECWRRIAAQDDDTQGDKRGLLLMALNGIGRVLEGLKNLDEAEECLTRSLLINPDQPNVIHHWVHLRQKRCAWPVLKPLPGLSAERMMACSSVLAMFDISDDPALQLASARRYVEEKVKLDLAPMAPAEPYPHDRLRIGYLSSDFCMHPVSLLMVELFERHDRARVEVYGFCWSKDDGSELRKRVVGALDHHIVISGLSDEEAARLIREREIDVLVDLHGLTSGARPGILAHRPAPVQVSYLGLPGTSGMPFVDYILCDRYLLPETEAAFYAESPLYMPEVFQVCDGKRPIGPTPTRASLGLPEDGFVFCAFNNPHKYTPEFFGLWMEILLATPGSVLWLLGDSPTIRQNLTDFAASRGVSPERLVFAARALPHDYLARYRIADLFLDSFPFNGGTTANDALFMGLPLLTLSGRAFASRMAGSLLTCLGLPELITRSAEEYRDLAVALAHDKPRLAALRQRLEDARAAGPLFDTGEQARKIEDLFLGLRGRPASKTAGANAAVRPASLPRLSPASPEAIMSYNLGRNWAVSDPAAMAALLGQLVPLLSPGVFATDNLITWGHHNWLFEDQPFRAAWQGNQLDASDESMVWRRYILACAGYHCAQLEGDFVDCGIGHGSALKTIVDYLGGAEFSKNCWGYDAGRANDAEFDQLRERFAQLPNVRLVRGPLPQAMQAEAPGRISLLQLNLRSASEELAVLEQCFDRVTPGGVVILGGYEWAGTDRPEKIELAQWLDARRYRVFPLPTGQGVVLKR